MILFTFRERCPVSERDIFTRDQSQIIIDELTIQTVRRFNIEQKQKTIIKAIQSGRF